MISLLLLLIVYGIWAAVTLFDQVTQDQWYRQHPREPMCDREWEDRQRAREWHQGI